MSVPRAGDLQVSQDLHFQNRSWVVQRIGWVLIALAILAGLLGLTGRGPLSGATAVSADGLLLVQHQRFDRHRAPTNFQIHLPAGSVTEDQVRVWIDRDYLEGLTIESVFPDPAQVEVGEDRVTYAFNVDRPNQPIRIGFQMIHEGIGFKRGRAGLDEREPVTFSQLIYP